MLEILFALSVMAFFALAALVLYYQSDTARRNRALTLQVQNVAQAVRTIFAGQRDYGATGADITPVIGASRSLPADMRSGDALRHVHNGPITITAQAANAVWAGASASAPSFVVSFANLPAEACAGLVSAIASGGGGGLAAVLGVAVGAGNAETPPLTVDAVSGSGRMCAQTAGRITVHFRLS